MSLQRDYEVVFSRDEVNWVARELQKYAAPKREFLKQESEDPADEPRRTEAKLLIELTDKISKVAQEGLTHAVQLKVKRQELEEVKQYCADDGIAIAAAEQALQSLPLEETYTITGARWAIKAIYDAVSKSLAELVTNTIPYYNHAADSAFRPEKPRAFYLGRAKEKVKFLESLQRKLDEALK